MHWLIVPPLLYTHTPTHHTLTPHTSHTPSQRAMSRVPNHKRPSTWQPLRLWSWNTSSSFRTRLILSETHKLKTSIKRFSSLYKVAIVGCFDDCTVWNYLLFLSQCKWCDCSVWRYSTDINTLLDSIWCTDLIPFNNSTSSCVLQLTLLLMTA